jgi:ketosteroid isomerase-like protein
LTNVSTNVDLVSSIFAAWERGDFGSVEWAHPEIEYVHDDSPAAGSWSGVANMAEAFRDFLGAWETFCVVADEYYEIDDERVLVLVHRSGRGKRSGVELAQMRSSGACLFHIQDGKVTRLFNYVDIDREQVLAEFGLTQELGRQSS